MLTLLKNNNKKSPSLTFGDPMSNTYTQIAQIPKHSTEHPISTTNKPSTVSEIAPTPATSSRVQIPNPTLQHIPTPSPTPTPNPELHHKTTPNPTHTPTPVTEPMAQAHPPAPAPRVQKNIPEDQY